MPRLERKSIKAHLNQDIKPPFAVLRLPESSSDLYPQMVMWQMISSKDMQDTETQSSPGQETAVWRQLWGPFCVKFKLLPHTHTHWRVQREMPQDSKGLSPWTAPSSLLWQWSTELPASKTKSTAQIEPMKTFQEYKDSRKLKILTRKQLCLLRLSELPRATECPQYPTAALCGEVNKRPMATAMKNRSPLKTRELKQRERKKPYFQCQHFWDPGTQKKL